MKTKDLMTITTVALGTATLTVMTFWSSPLEAGHEAEQITAKIAKPKLVAHGIEMTLTTAADRIFLAGDEPQFALTAMNTTRADSMASILVKMTAAGPEDFRSRVPRVPSVLWQQSLVLDLKASESKTITLPARISLPTNSMIAVYLEESSSPRTSGAVTTLQVEAPRQVRSVIPEPGIQMPSGRGIVALSFSTGKPAALAASVR